MKKNAQYEKIQSGYFNERGLISISKLWPGVNAINGLQACI